VGCRKKKYWQINDVLWLYPSGIEWTYLIYSDQLHLITLCYTHLYRYADLHNIEYFLQEAIFATEATPVVYG